MSKIKLHRLLRFNANVASCPVFLCILFFSFSVKSNALESKKSSAYQNNSALLSNNSLKKSKTDFDVTNEVMKLICYFVFTENINPEILEGLCTHIHVGFFGIEERTNKLKVSDLQEQILTKILLLKAKSSDLKIIISVGGTGNMGFSRMVSNHTTRKMFIKSCLGFLKKFDIDGIDLDWEWPVAVNGNEKEKVKFVQLLQEIKQEFKKYEKKHVLSVDVPSVPAIIELGYYVKYIADFVDYVNVMCYDYHFFTKLFPFTGHNAPLYSRGDDLFSKVSVNSSISYWISNAMPRGKIVLGIPTYGHTFELTFMNHHSLMAPARGFGSVGQDGFAGYQQICQFLKNKKTTIVYDAFSKTPYAYQFPEWISYDDEGSVAMKVTYALEEELAGVMIFSVNTDDFAGSCKGDNIPLPLIKKARNILLNEV